MLTFSICPVEDRVLNIQKDKNRMITDAFSGTKGAVHEREKQQARFRDIAAALGYVFQS